MQYRSLTRRLAPALLLSAVSLASPPAVAQTVVVDTLAPSYPAISSTIVGPSIAEADWAMRFTPSTGGNLSLVEAAIGHLSGSGALTITLMDDASGLPGAALVSWTFGSVPSVTGGFPDFELIGATATASSPLTPTLTAGAPYWLAAFASGDGVYGWLGDSVLAGPGEVALSNDGATWTPPPPGAKKGGLKVAIIAAAAGGGAGVGIAMISGRDAGVVPEPGTYAAGGAMAIAALLTFHKRGLRRTKSTA